jgi:hypothetical protein
MAQVISYLDAGTGSMIVQVLLGGLAAVGVALKIYWRRLMRLLRIRKPEPAAAEQTSGSESG